MNKSPAKSKPTFIWSVTQHLTLGPSQAQAIARSLMQAVLFKKQSGAYAIWYALHKRDTLHCVVGSEKGLPIELCKTLITQYAPTSSDLDHSVLCGLLYDGYVDSQLSVGWRDALVEVMNSQPFRDWAAERMEVKDEREESEDLAKATLKEAVDTLKGLGYTVKTDKAGLMITQLKSPGSPATKSTKNSPKLKGATK